MNFIEDIKIKTMHKILENFPFSVSEMATSSFDANGKNFSMTSLKHNNIEFSITLKTKDKEEIEHLSLKSEDESINIDLWHIERTEETRVLLAIGLLNTLKNNTEEEDEY